MRIRSTINLQKLLTLFLVSITCFWLLSCSAYADNEQTVRIDEAASGALLFRTETAGQFIAAPVLATDVKLQVSGPIIRAIVTQKFTNTSDQWVEGLYVFPLPDQAAVDHMSMIVGGRVIEGKIQEKTKARQTYETAKEAGKHAALIEQSRPNIFMNSVANIGPGETVIVQIEYQDTAQLSDGWFSLHFPLSVAPRFSPKERALLVRANTQLSTTARPLALSVDLTAGFDLAEITSPSHQISVRGDDTKSIELVNPNPANRDFILNWRAKNSPSPVASIFVEEGDDETYVMAMVQSPLGMGDTQRGIPRDVVFVIDNSGSMAGKSITQARLALQAGLDGLGPNDLFNVIQFDNETKLLFENSVPASRQNLLRAQGFVAALSGNGGTVMLPALQAALRTENSPAPATETSGRLRQVVFITDGQIDNEAELFTELGNNLGQSRLFVVAIGSAPNRYFASRAARIGRGIDLVINDLDEVGAKMTAFLQKLERPAMRDLQAQLRAQPAAQIWPNPIPDLYPQQPVVLLARLANSDDALQISGLLGAGRWDADLDLSHAKPANGIGVLWARSKIRNLEEGRFTGRATSEIDRQVLAVALQHHLVSRLTSLVAVDVTPARAPGDDLQTIPLPLHLPEGWADIETRNSMNGLAKPAPRPAPAPGLTLPATASMHSVQVILGLLLLALALVLSSRVLPKRARR